MAVNSQTDADTAIPEFEDLWWRTAAAKEDTIREQLGLTPVRYYVRLCHLLNSEAAVAYDPVLINRLRRIARARSRAA
jgi:Protein of unknown function (DUF3263)